jgi:hypothetical protein
MVLPQPAEGPGPRLIKEGDLVIVYESFLAIKSAYVDSKATYASRFGKFPHKARARPRASRPARQHGCPARCLWRGSMPALATGEMGRLELCWPL